MRRIAKALIHLYPCAWRDRYGHELEALLEDTGASWISIPDILMEVFKMRLQTLNWRVALVCAITGLALATAASFRLTPRYTATAVVRFDAGSETQREELQDLRRSVLSRVSLSDLIQTPGLDLYKDQRRNRAYHDVITDMRESDVEVEVISSPNPGLQVSYTGFSPSVTTAVAARLAERILDRHDTTRNKVLRLAAENKIEPRQVGNLVINSTARVAEPPTVSAVPSRPVRWRYALLGILAGLAVWAWLTFVRRATRLAFRVSLAALLIVAISYAIHFPYISQAVLVFDSPETLQTLLSDQTVQHASKTVSVEREGARVLAITASAAKYNFRAQRKAQEYITAILKAANSRYSSYDNSLLYPAGHWVDIVDTPSLPTFYSGANWRGATMVLGILTLLTALAIRRFTRLQHA